MKTKFLALGLAACCFTAPVAAQEITGNVALATDYIFRGITQTDNGPAISGGFDVESGGFYGGVWASSVDFSDDTTMELDLYGGYGFAAGGFDFDVGGIYYAYPDSPSAGGDQNFFELYGGIARSFDILSWDAKLSYSPEFYGETGPAIYLETGLGLEIGAGITLDGRVGASRFDDFSGADYEDYSIGLSGTIFDNVGWGLRAHDVSGGGNESVVLSFSQSFGG
ncbi:hypothetical protein AWH62_00220 [Maricaulis sp. W15]|uniref:TorF family putative porin n=1 Tax=Maricaulis sp. W15 TaxID=1772333 RepID=UPI000948B7D6|nr:TorF family putative porin [Maricaulis sp. W15]OLF81136.1 hypothetical protein AWH62_00220 [Maricaulis sp. W15]